MPRPLPPGATRMPTPGSAVNLPLFHYVITLKDGRSLECDAHEFHDADEWMVFDDAHGTVKTVLRELVADVARSGNAVGQQEVDKS